MKSINHAWHIRDCCEQAGFALRVVRYVSVVILTVAARVRSLTMDWRYCLPWYFARCSVQIKSEKKMA
jgi:hypothetical protein